MSDFKDEKTLTTIPELHKDLPGPANKDHDPKLARAEEEILQHYKDFAYFCNFDCKDHPNWGKKFYDLDEAMYFDLMGSVQRPGFRPHYDNITPYLADAQIAFKDLEITAVTETFGYATALQRYWGVAADGNAFDFTFRTTSLVRKRDDGNWKYVHEHFSFPVNMATQKADLTSGLKIEENIRLE
ncbi:hypothetical protein BU16DRAFT_565432 [Lophium mytilinum]|uniref:SnoaL-like domain-containing protein n=1 Tax=Lophium mytilinum TaxID=390894 RepID=A0A6A6QHP3_9PEZI|nr:hypothetical protein BU16DRAFT_565432 [Lophium mytilinum]